ncbi:MAG: septum formation initiator family protein [Bacteroidota bacterium]
MKVAKKILSIVKNKYFIASVIFLAWMFWFDPKDIPSDIARRNKYSDLQNSEKHLTELIAKTKSELNELKTNAQTIEKYAREKYLMKKDNEDLFILPADSTAK